MNHCSFMLWEKWKDMKQEKKYRLHLFIWNILLIIPLMIVSIAGTILLSRDAYYESRENSEKLFQNTVLDMSNMILEYQERATYLCNIPELKRGLRSVEGTVQREAFELMFNMIISDSKIINMFLDYDQEYLYSMKGLVEPRIFYGNTMGSNAESLNRGLQRIEGNNPGVDFLYKSDEVFAMAIYCVPNVPESKKAYVGFVLSMSDICKLFRMTDNNQWYLLETADGNKCAIGFDSVGQAKIISDEQWTMQKESGKYYQIVDDILDQGLTISLYSEKFLYRFENEMWNIQILNIVLLLVAIFISVFFSWRTSCNQFNNILELREFILGNKTKEIKENQSLYLLKEPIMKLQEYEKLSLLRQQELRQQIIYTLFYGMVEEDNIEKVLQQLGVKSVPELFCIITICAVESNNSLPNLVILNNCLHIQIDNELFSGVAFLYEMHTEDRDKAYRMQLAHKIEECVRKEKMEVKIAFSKVYKDLSQMGYVYRESMRSMKQLITNFSDINILCGDEILSNVDYILPNRLYLCKIADYLNKQDFESARIWCHRILNQEGICNCSQVNIQYIRYSVQQKLVEYFSSKDDEVNSKMIQHCLGMNDGNDDDFANKLDELLDWASSEKEHSGFIEILRYIDDNFHRYDLSYDEVAEIADVSPGHLSKLFRKKLGVTYIEYLISVRLEHSTELLKNAELKIDEISKMVGYENTSSYRKRFKIRYGISPAEYRLKMYGIS